MEVKLRARDGAGRILEIKLKSGRKLLTPTFFPVYNPHLPIITPEELKKEFGWRELITNAYIIWRDVKLSRRAEEVGVHRLLDFDGVVMMDSGAYQMWMYGRIEVTNEEIIEFQNRIGPDIGTFQDTIVSHGAPRDEAKRGIEETIRKAEVCKELGSENIEWLATVQGSSHTDLVRTAAERLRELSFDYYAIGGLAGAATKWLFTPFIDFTVESLRVLPRSRPVHAWGIGHPAVFSLFVIMGVDSFDSASYALYAKDDRLLFPWGTERLENVEELPFTHPELRNYTVKELRDMPRDMRVRLLAKHNLWVILEEIRAIREAIRGEYLFEYVQERVRSHPRLYEAYRLLLNKHKSFLEMFTPFSKKHGLFYVGEEFLERPEVVRAKKLLERFKGRKRKTIHHPVFGKIPVTLSYTYPFGQTLLPGWEEEVKEFDPRERVVDIVLYQWGVELEADRLRVELRKGRARKVYLGERYIGTVRPHDGLFVPSIEGARILAKEMPFPRGRIVVEETAKGPVSEGRSVFTKFVLDADPELRPGQEVIVVDSSDRVIAVGKLVLSPREIEEFDSHVAVKVRHGSKG